MSEVTPTEADNAVFFIGNVNLIFLTGHVRLAVPFVLGKVYDLVEALPETPGIPSGLALRDGKTTAHHGWIKTATRDPSNSLERVRTGLQTAGAAGHVVARIKVTRVGSLFETVDRHGAKQVGVQGNAICWVDNDNNDADSEGR